MEITNEETAINSSNLENIYKLMRELKQETDRNALVLQQLNEKTSNIINEVTGILEETAKDQISNIEENEEGVEKRVLLISSKTQKVVLPYTKQQIKELVENGKYETEEQAIRKEYTLPLSKYKNEVISRITEGYRLARKKDNKSIIESLTYAMNLMFERRLHPAIITACSSTDELDIYLACLDENVTNLFDFFEVVFEYSPLEVKKR